MKVRLHNRDFTDLILEQHYPEGFRVPDDKMVIDRTINASLLGCGGAYREIFLENIHIGYGDLHMYRPTEVYFETEGETVEMHFALLGETQAQDAETKQSYAFGYNHHNIFYAGGFRGCADYSTQQNIKIFEVNLLPSFFKRFLPQNSRHFVNFSKQMERQETALLQPHNFSITPAMHLIIREILGCQRNGAFKRIFLEAKVIELLLLQLEQLAALHDTPSYSLRKRDLDKMHAVKEYLLAHLASPLTLLGLARQFNTNEYMLKKGFKEVFGTTVFGFWNDAKMEEAKKMLLQQDVTINQVSDRIGYKNPQHFSTAFKRKFGYVPSKLKRVRN